MKKAQAYLVTFYYLVLMMQQKSYIPTALEQANKNPAFNKEKRCSKDYYKTISILPHLSNFLKIYVSPNVSLYG